MDIQAIEKTASLAENNQMSLMVFQMDDSKQYSPTYYAINVSKVREVIEGRRYPIAQVPGNSSLVEGVIQLRGNFIPIIDLPSWLGMPMTPENEEKSVIIVCDFSHTLVGFRVAHIYGVVEKSWSEMSSVKNLGDASSKLVNQTTVKNKDRDDICYIVDVEGLLAESMPDMAQKLNPEIHAENWMSYYKGKTILVADDAKVIRQYLSQVLDKSGIHYEIFNDGQQLINRIEALSDEAKVAAVITDLEMPEASGYTVIKHIRNDSKIKTVPIAVHSSMTGSNNERDAMKLGANYFIGKIDTDGFIDILKQIALEQRG